MTAPPWMPLYVADYLADTRHLGAAEHGAYLLLLMHQWQHGYLPDDPRKLARIACALPHQWPKIWHQLNGFFRSQADGKLENKRLASEMSKQAEISSKRKDAALQMHKKRRAVAGDVQATLHDDLHTHYTQHTTHTQDSVGAYAPTSARAQPPDGPDDWPEDYRAQFAEAYPHKVGMKAALVALDRVRGSRAVAWAVLIDAVIAYAGKTDDRRWCNPKTWLEQERWNDRPAPQPAGNGRPRSSNADIAAQLAREAEERERGAGDAGGEAHRIGGAEAGGDHAQTS